MRKTRLLTATEAAKYLRVSRSTLDLMVKGGLESYRTPGGHRRFSLQQLNKFLHQSRRG